MKVNLHTRLAGPAGTYQPGQHDLPDELARLLIAGRFASEIAAAPAKTAEAAPIETATQPAAETATAPRGRRGK